jgi:hypothetical protein
MNILDDEGNTASRETLPDSNIEKTQTEIAALEEKIVGLKNKIGDHYWRLYSNTGYTDPPLVDIYKEIAALCKKIAVMESSMAAVEEEENQLIQPPIEFILGYVTCGLCNTINDSRADFCSSCGGKLG